MPSNYFNKPKFTKSPSSAPRRQCHDILNSNVKTLAQELLNLNLNSSHLIQFPTTLNNQVGPSLSIQRLENLDPEHIEQWVMQLRLIIETSKMAQDDPIKILKIVISPNLHYLLLEQTDPEKVIDKIFSETFPKKNFFIYDNNLKRMKLKNYTTITDFKKQFTKQLKFANFCIAPKDKISEREEFGYLEHCIPYKILKRLYEEDKLTVERAFFLLEQEESFSERMLEIKGITKEDNTYTFKNKEQTKWCKYHKSRYHNTSDCLTGKQSNRDKNEIDNRSKDIKSFKRNFNNYITENTSEENEIKLTLETKSGNMTALIDTGSKLNYISKETAYNLRISNLKPLEEPKTMVTANNTQEEISQCIDLEFSIKSLPDIIFQEKFFVVARMPIQANLGYEFLKKHNCLLNIKNKEIKLNNYIVQYDRTQEESIDSEVRQAIHDKNITIKEHNKTTEMIEQYKKGRYEGIIPGFKHKIDLIEPNKIVQLKEYPVAISLEEETRKEISKLLDNKIN